MKTRIRCLILLTALLCVNGGSAADWNQWRGPNRDGSAADFVAPKIFPEQLKQIWSLEVGIGYSSPVISVNRVFLLTRVGEQEVISCYDLAGGKQLWKDSYDAPYTVNPAAALHAKGPKSTPVVADGRLFTLGISGILSSYDAASGKLLWRKDFLSEFSATSPDFGTAMSPLIDRGLLIVHAGGPDHGALLALDVKTGEQKWSWNGDGPAYASPIVVEITGTRQVVTQSQQYIVGVAVSNGELLWKIPFTTDYTQNIVTPVTYKDMVIFSGLNKGAFAVRLSNEEGKWNPEIVWKNDRAAMYMTSPVIHGDYVYGMTHFRKGQFFCLDARTGVTQWTSVGAEGENAWIVNGGNVLLFLTSDADLTIVSTSEKEYQVLKKYVVAKSSTWSHPAIAGNRFLIKDLNSLTLWSFE